MAGNSVPLRRARVIAGDGGTPGAVDVCLEGNRIAEVGRLSVRSTDEVVDFDGLVLAPGFIDTHTHTDCVAFLNSTNEALQLASLRQGVTTQVCGNCGFSPFPVLNSQRLNLELHLLQALGPGTRVYPALSEWRRAVSDAGLWTNLAPLVGHRALRASVMSFEDRAPTEAEMLRMEELLGQCLADGAFGLSTGLIYSPGMFARTDELVRLPTVAAGSGALYAGHLRNETDGVHRAVDEALTIGRRAGAGVHISHHKVAGQTNWGRTRETLGTSIRLAAMDWTSRWTSIPTPRKAPRSRRYSRHGRSRWHRRNVGAAPAQTSLRHSRETAETRPPSPTTPAFRTFARCFDLRLPCLCKFRRAPRRVRERGNRHAEDRLHLGPRPSVVQEAYIYRIRPDARKSASASSLE